MISKHLLLYPLVLGLALQPSLSSAASGGNPNRQSELKQQEALEEDLKAALEEREVQESQDQGSLPMPVLLDHEPGESLVRVETFSINTSELISNETIQSYLSVYEGQEISMRDLQNLINAINQLYKTQNHHTAVATIPEQDIRDGEIEIKLVEGRISEIQLENSKYTKESYVRDRIGMESGELLRLNDLEKKLACFNANTDINVLASLAPGEGYGTTDITLQLLEPDNYQATAYVNNQGNAATGRTLGGLTFQSPSLFGYRDPFLADISKSEGSLNANVFYKRPINSLDTKLGFCWSYSDTEVIDEELEDLNIVGDSSVYTAMISHPFVKQVNQSGNITLRMDAKKSKTLLDGVTYKEEDYQNLRLGVDYKRFIKSGLIYASFQWTHGMGRDTAPEGDNDEFYKLNGDLFFIKNFSEKIQSTLRFSFQLASKELPAAEAFELGGMGTVRGYDEGLASGYTGYVLSEEVRLPFYLIPESFSFRGYAIQLRNHVDQVFFIDCGGWKDTQTYVPTESRFLASIGTGLRIRVKDSFHVSMDVAYPLCALKDNDESLRFHLKASYRFY